MALFAGQPAGIQIKKWLIILVSLIVVIAVLLIAWWNQFQEMILNL
jgi:hypothetical protein